MTIDDRMVAASAGITSMSDTEVSQHLNDLLVQHRARSTSDIAREAAELDTLELDVAAYELAQHLENVGDLCAAARWYRQCAAADFSDAALRLARVLNGLSGQRAAGSDPARLVRQRNELALVSDAARWYIEAYAAGHPEAEDELDEMIRLHDIRGVSHRTSNDDKPPARSRQKEPECEQGGLRAIVEANDLAGATAHFQQCTACQHEFVSSGGLLPSIVIRRQNEQPRVQAEPPQAPARSLALSSVDPM